MRLCITFDRGIDNDCWLRYTNSGSGKVKTMDTKKLDKILKLHKAGLSLRDIRKIVGGSHEAIRLAILKYGDNKKVDGEKTSLKNKKKKIKK